MERTSERGAEALSIIAAGGEIVGDLKFPGVVEVHGTISGTLSAQSIVVSESGVIKGNLSAADITVRGAVDGQVTGGAVALHSKARVAGEVLYGRLTIENGAEVNAQVRRTSGAAPARERVAGG